MKKIITIALSFTTALIFGQAPSSFTLNKDGLTDFIVTDSPNQNQSQLYKKTLDWVQAKYQNVTETVKDRVENDRIIIESTTKPLVSLNPAARVNHLSKYQVEIAFKEGKYKFDLLSLEYYVAPSQIDAGGWRKINLSDVKEYYTRMGELRPTYKYFPEIADFFNKLNDELRQFLLGETTAVKKSEW